ncbi:MAG: 50S ribosomal protein L25 [Acidimicrobiia bacterium]
MDVTLSAAVGRTTGSRSSRRLRREGKVPGVLYGLGKDDVSVAVEYRALRQALTTDAGLNALITMSVDGNNELCIVRDLQRHPVRNEVIHVDFVRVDAHAEIQIDVPVVLEGEPRKVLSEQGVVDQVLYHLAVYAKADAIPNELVVDISELEIGETIIVADVSLPVGARTEVDPEEVVVTASITRAEVEVTEDEETDEEAPAEEAASDEE